MDRRLGLYSAFMFALTLVACAGLSPGPFRGGDASVPLLDGGIVDAGPCGACPAEAPFCDAKARTCAACLKDADCPEASLCRMGQCMPGCAAGRGNCGDAGSCDVDLGVCRGCNSDRECNDRNLPYCDKASGRCNACSLDNDQCPVGTYCGESSGVLACTPGCKADAECAQNLGPGGACCAHACVATSSSKDHCGACGKACAGACCAGACSDPNADAANCGACGNACMGGNAEPACQAGVCAFGMCLAGFGDCDRDPANGCEINLASDLRNCGGCGKGCVLDNANALCLAGACSILGCQAGFRDCNLDSADGCEVDSRSDAANCGICGLSCGKLPNAVAACDGGQCRIGMCNAGFGDCNGKGDDGCETALDMNFDNCGACGNACPRPPGVQATCTQGQCALAGCAPGFIDCDANLANGCEAQPEADARNCGGCGVVCNGNNGAPSCAQGVCAIACSAGFSDCDANLANGCEVDLNTNAAHCGACGNACQGGATCRAGQCAVSTRITAPGEAYGHHGACSGWNGCGTAQTCALWACEVKGFGQLVSFGRQASCRLFNVCHLFNSRGSVQYNWGTSCDVMGVSEIDCR